MSPLMMRLSFAALLATSALACNATDSATDPADVGQDQGATDSGSRTGDEPGDGRSDAAASDTDSEELPPDAGADEDVMRPAPDTNTEPVDDAEREGDAGDAAPELGDAALADADTAGEDIDTGGDGDLVDEDIAGGGDVIDEDADTSAPPGNTVRGALFWNLGPVPDGSLLVALTATNPATAPLVAEALQDPAVLPRGYVLNDVPAGAYYVLVFLDVGRDSSWDAPGPEDFWGITAEPTAVSELRPDAENINVELR